eukprot:548674_1
MDAESRIEALEQKLQFAEEQIAYLKQELSQPSTTTTNKHSDTFWTDLQHKCIHDPEAVKLMIKNKTISMTDTDKTGSTLLHYAAEEGQYDIVQLCINLGADINAQNKKGQKPIDAAKSGSWYHVEQ